MKKMTVITMMTNYRFKLTFLKNAFKMIAFNPNTIIRIKGVPNTVSELKMYLNLAIFSTSLNKHSMLIMFSNPFPVIRRGEKTFVRKSGHRKFIDSDAVKIWL